MKKGELTINYIIVVILALLVLIIIAIIFRDQVGSFVSNIKELSSSFGSSIKQSTTTLTKTP